MYGPWTTYDCLYKRNGTTIYKTDCNNVIKVSSGHRLCEELPALLTICPTVHHAVEIPDEPYDRFGVTEDGEGWYVMRRYDGHVSCGDPDWETIGVACINFLEDLHHKLHRVHADIKRQNILQTKEDGSRWFVIADYEHVVAPTITPLSTYDLDYQLYYLGRGAELDKPYKCWRYDLTSVAYMLFEITSPTATFIQAFSDRRIGVNTISVDELMAMRNEQMKVADKKITEYLDRVGELDWTDRMPPPHSFYDDLRSILLS
jgi:hypothetical protein